MSSSRRYFLRTAAAGGVTLGLGDLSFLSRLRPVSAAESRLDSKTLQFQPEIEPLVRLLEETPRARLLEEVAARIQRGLSYRDLLAALLLAGVKNVQPRPVGFKFHAVLVVNSAHLASLSSPDAHRWLPIFWALDHFKSSQAANLRDGGWIMQPANELAIPPARKARQMFMEAMDNWDEPAADAAVAGLARSAGSNELFEIFCRYGARDFRAIGHKAIYVANAWRTLNCIGWQHAEPVLRSLAYALLAHEGDNPAKRDADADRPWRVNQSLATRIRPDWLEGKISDAGTRDMLAVLRDGSNADACNKAVELINQGVSPASVWDALLAGAGELLMRQPGIVALHAVTTTNALYYAFTASEKDETRRLLLLQNTAFLPMFRAAMKGRGQVKDVRIDQVEPAELKSAGPQAVEEIFAAVSQDRLTAARKTLTYLKNHPQAKELINAARVLVFTKGNDSHDYKFSSAILEDYYHASPAWRDRFLAAGMFQLRGAAGPDNALVQRTREALKS